MVIISHVHNVSKAHRSVRESGDNSRRSPKGLMNPDKVVVHGEQRKMVIQVFNFLGETIRLSDQPGYVRPQSQVVPLNVAGRDMFLFWISDDAELLQFQVVGVPFPIVHRVFFPENSVVESAFENDPGLNSVQVIHVSICGHLKLFGKTIGNIREEGVGGDLLTGSSDQVRKQDATLGVNGSPNPGITSKMFFFQVRGGILFLGIAESPDLVTLDPPELQIAECSVLEPSACISRILKQAQDRVFGNLGEVLDVVDPVFANEMMEHGDLEFSGKVIHSHGFWIPDEL